MALTTAHSSHPPPPLSSRCATACAVKCERPSLSAADLAVSQLVLFSALHQLRERTRKREGSFISMAQEQAKEEPKGLFTSIFDGVKNVGSSVVDGVGKVSRSFHPKLGDVCFLAQ